MMIEYIKRHDLDIVLVQEMSKDGLVDTNGYNVYYNVGPDMRGTAIMVKQKYLLTNITKIPLGRAIAADFREYRFVKIYAPSGTSKRAEREIFFNKQLPECLYTHAKHFIRGGDFNCVLVPEDTTATPVTSRALRELVNGLQLVDT
jgi:exonuclease III